ncbi:hypothetical protein K0U07_05390 [bacterium]|nr:hypothetical protein [bacterium]
MESLLERNERNLIQKVNFVLSGNGLSVLEDRMLNLTLCDPLDNSFLITKEIGEEFCSRWSSLRSSVLAIHRHEDRWDFCLIKGIKQGGVESESMLKVQGLRRSIYDNNHITEWNGCAPLSDILLVEGTQTPPRVDREEEGGGGGAAAGNEVGESDEAAGGGAAGRASIVIDPPLVEVMPGLPNLVGTCFINVVTQLIAYTPEVECLIRAAAPEDVDGERLQSDLLALAETMKRGEGVLEVSDAVVTYWKTFNNNLRKVADRDLIQTRGNAQDVRDYIRYLGKRLGIYEFLEGMEVASCSLLETGQFPTELEGDPRVIILNFPESMRRGYAPPDEITVNGGIYTLQGFINRPTYSGHFTSVTKVSGGNWVNQDDHRVSGKVSAEERDLSGVYVMCYVKNNAIVK